jgi:hypothetical protein
MSVSSLLLGLRGIAGIDVSSKGVSIARPTISIRIVTGYLGTLNEHELMVAGESGEFLEAGKSSRARQQKTS